MLQLQAAVFSESALSSGCRISSPDSGLHSSSAPGSTDPFGEEPSHKLWDELGQIGLPDDITIQSLFDPTGKSVFFPHVYSLKEPSPSFCFVLHIKATKIHDQPVHHVRAYDQCV